MSAAKRGATFLAERRRSFLSQQQQRSSSGTIRHDSLTNLSVKKKLKELGSWFALWHKWQRRIFVCRLVEHCSNGQLRVLSTALEPALHLDFSSSLGQPLMAALHHDSSQIFKIRRAVTIYKTKQEDRDELPALLVPSVSSQDGGTGSRKIVLPHIVVPAEDEQPVVLEADSSENTSNSKKSKTHVILPALPLSHVKHKPSPASSDIKQQTYFSSLPPIERKYNSVPNIPTVIHHYTTTGPHKRIRHNTDRLHYQQRTFNWERQSQKFRNNHKRQLELFKGQLESLSKWMSESSRQEVAYLLCELVKLCDKELLGYLVQCVYQKLLANHGIDSLSDHILLKIFSYLNAPDLCKCATVCRRWYNLTGRPQLWKELCAALGQREELGDLVCAIESVHEMARRMALLSDGSKPNSAKASSSVIIDWKQAYRDLTRLMSKMKVIVLKKALTSTALEQRRKEEMRIRNLTSAQLRSSLTLREMLDIVRFNSTGGRPIKSSSTHEVLLSAPESAATLRRRRKEEKLAAQHNAIKETETEFLNGRGKSTLASKLLCHQPQKRFASSGDLCVTHLLEVAIDTRPCVPSLPNPEGIECLVLAGYLSHNNRPRPGRAEPIPSLERLPFLGTSVLCIQCDERKIVAGCADRLIRMFDIRSGRIVSEMSGHKGSVKCLQFDDNKIVSGSWDMTCIVWDIVRFKPVRILTGHLDCVSCLQFNSSGILVTGSYDKTLKIWEMLTWSCTRTISPAHSKPITCISFNGFTIVSGSEDKTVKFWDAHSGEFQGSLNTPGRITSLQLSKLLLATACSNGIIYLWNAATYTLMMQWQLEYSVIVGCVNDTAIDKGKIYAAGSDGVIHEWDIATGACVRMIQGHSKSLTAIWVGNSKIVSAAEDQTICVWQPDKFIFQSGETESFYSYVPIKMVTMQK